MKLPWMLAVAALLGLGGQLRADTIDSTAGLVYHLTADSGVTSSSGAVSAWTDSNSVYTFSQGSASLQPTLVSNAIKGHAALQFTANNGSQLATTTSASIQTVIIVCETDSTTKGFGGIWGKGGSGSDYGIRRYNSTAIAGWQEINSNDFGYGGFTSINGTTTASAVGNGGTDTVYCDTASSWEILVVSASSAQTWSTGAAIGNYFSLNGFAYNARAWSGEIAELATFSGTLSTSQLNAIGYELSQKYGITTAYTVPEPSTMMLIGSGLMALSCFVLRKRRSKKL